MSDTDRVHDEIKLLTDDFFSANGLRHFKIPIPMQGHQADTNMKGISEKIRKNKSRLVTALNKENEGEDVVDMDEVPPEGTSENPKAEGKRERPKRNSTATESQKFESDQTISDKLQKVRSKTAEEDIVKLINRLNDEINGFIFILAEEWSEPNGGSPSASSSGAKKTYRPVAGGVFEYLACGDREIRALWCRRSVPDSDATALNRALCVRILSEAFLYTPADEEKGKGGVKSASVQGSLLLAFPDAAAIFLKDTDGLQLSPHYELEKGSHQDSLSTKCQCVKYVEKKLLWKEHRSFWGIPESRFVKKWKNRSGISCLGEPFMPKGEPLPYFKQAAEATGPKSPEGQSRTNSAQVCATSAEQDDTESKGHVRKKIRSEKSR